MKRLTPLLALFLLFGLVLATRPALAQPIWNSQGWIKLGEREVDGRLDRDHIEVGTQDGVFSRLTLVVERGEIELVGFEITFGNGERWHPETFHHYFREGQRTREIEFPVAKMRMIKSINLRYKNVGEGGRARVEVWGFKPDTHPGAVRR